MAMTKEEIISHIKTSIPDAYVKIDDFKGDGDHYSAIIISKAFLGKNKVDQHKMVYNSLKGKMGIKLHALTIKTKTE